MHFTLENIRLDEKVEGKWWFSVCFQPTNRCGHLQSNGWKYYEDSNQIRRPSAQGAYGKITNVDEQTLELMRAYIKVEIKARTGPVHIRSVIVLLRDRYLKAGAEWKEVFAQLDEETQGLKGATTASQLIAYVCAATLARIKPADDVFPTDVLLPKSYKEVDRSSAS